MVPLISHPSIRQKISKFPPISHMLHFDMSGPDNALDLCGFLAIFRFVVLVDLHSLDMSGIPIIFPLARKVLVVHVFPREGNFPSGRVTLDGFS